jgi:ribosome maturation factor RimP
MINTEKIEKIVKDWTENKDIFFVALSIGSGNTIKVLLDKPEGITIDECVVISRMIEAKLNRDEEDYELQVSSPGLSMPFKVIEQYYKNRGNKIEVITQDGSKMKGILNKVTDKGIQLGIKTRIKKEKKKKVIPENISLDFNQIKTAKTVIAFK